MSKKREFIRLARQAGIVSPSVTYDRRAKGYHVAIGSIPNPYNAGYVDIEIALYDNLNETRDRIEADIRACIDHNIDRYPDILKKVTITYEDVTLSDRDRTYQWLDGLSRDDDSDTAQSAKIALNYFEVLESQARETTRQPKGTYKTTLTEPVERKPLQWQQPDYRNAPVYYFDLECPYCGRSETLERRRNRRPPHCGRDDCQQVHERTLARDRKRRQRARQKKNET